jgi:hypothetical protein
VVRHRCLGESTVGYHSAARADRIRTSTVAAVAVGDHRAERCSPGHRLQGSGDMRASAGAKFPSNRVLSGPVHCSSMLSTGCFHATATVRRTYGDPSSSQRVAGGATAAGRFALCRSVCGLDDVRRVMSSVDHSVRHIGRADSAPEDGTYAATRGILRCADDRSEVRRHLRLAYRTPRGAEARRRTRLDNPA